MVGGGRTTRPDRCSLARTPVARQFINRDMLAARTVADALARATVAPRATGFSANLASLYDGTDTMLNLEVSAEAHSVFVVTDHYYHFNMYRHLNVSQEVDESTVHREARAEAMPAAETMSGALQILGDTADKAYPIYRNGAPPDTGYPFVLPVVGWFVFLRLAVL